MNRQHQAKHARQESTKKKEKKTKKSQSLRVLRRKNGRGRRTHGQSGSEVQYAVDAKVWVLPAIPPPLPVPVPSTPQLPASLAPRTMSTMTRLILPIAPGNWGTSATGTAISLQVCGKKELKNEQTHVHAHTHTHTHTHTLT